jgi:hypothetical protein
MADQSHLNILQQGVEAWNSWREQKRNVRPDLSEANLSRANLREAVANHERRLAQLRERILQFL